MRGCVRLDGDKESERAGSRGFHYFRGGAKWRLLRRRTNGRRSRLSGAENFPSAGKKLGMEGLRLSRNWRWED